MVQKILIWLWLPWLVLAACTRDDGGAGAGDTPPVTATSTRPATGAMLRPNTPVPSATPTTSPTPSPTPVPAQLEVADQVLAEDGLLTVARASLPADGWLVVYALAADGSLEEVLGWTAVAAGVQTNLTVTVPPLAATPTLLARLHQDAGAVGEFEFPGPDAPWDEAADAAAAGQTVATLAVTVQFTLPAVAVADQDIGATGRVNVATVYAAAPAWLAVHAAGDTGMVAEPGPLLGVTHLSAGLHEDVSIPISPREAPLELVAVLYEDAGSPGRFDYPGADTPVLVDGEPVAVPFRISLPPDVFVLDQPLVNGEIMVERVVSDGPGWIVVQFDDEGAPGLIIGFAPLQDGVNEQVVVPVVETAASDTLFLMLHDDTGVIGEFEFPRGDPQRQYNGLAVDPVPFRINPGNSLFTRDQAVVIGATEPVTGTTAVTGTVTVPLVISDLDTWVVIRNQVEGDLGEIIGQAWLPPGLNRDVPVVIDLGQVTPTLYAVLHHDADGDQVFDFPEADPPLQRNRLVIRAPFAVTVP